MTRKDGKPTDPGREAADWTMELTVLGARGSMAIGRADCMVFGGSTSCYMVRAGADCIILDAGSRLISAPKEFPKPPLILLSHLHLDHLLGLGMYARLATPGLETFVLVPAKSRREARENIDRLFSPPLWPISVLELEGDVHVVPLQLPLRRGKLTVEGIKGRHRGGCMVFKVRCGEKTIVYATDYEPDERSFAALTAFSRNADLLLYDAQFDTPEYESKKGYGHSTPEKGIELMELCGAKRLLLIHHAPLRNDARMLAREAALGRDDVRFAREGDVIRI